MENTGKKITITIFTDPLCCWSWAFETQLRQLKSTLGDTVRWEYRMGGLIPNWNNFYDNVNAVSRPMQMGPVWMHAGQVANKPIHHQLWIKDAPASSYPACIAVKCAQLQSSDAGEAMLGLLRDACMIHGKNIAKQEVLFEAANDLHALNKDFDIKQFKADFLTDKGLESFRQDLQLVSYYRINRFPTLVITPPEGQPVIVSGYKNYTQVLKAIETSCTPV